MNRLQYITVSNYSTFYPLYVTTGVWTRPLKWNYDLFPPKATEVVDYWKDQLPNVWWFK